MKAKKKDLIFKKIFNTYCKCKARKNYPEAIQQFELANKMIKEYSFADELTDLYRLNNETEKAQASAEKVIEMLGEGAGKEVVVGYQIR